jgi:hypothetical protein
LTENPQQNILERYGLDQLRRWNRRDAWAVHPLDTAELERLRQLERRTLVLAALAGALSGAILGGAEVVTDGRWGTFDFELWREQWRTWAAYLSLVVVVSGVEVAFLYWNALRGAGGISAFAGLQLAGHDTGERVARALVRAALELPNPRERIYGVDPYARTPRWKLTLLALAYKLKVSATSFILRILLRRLLARAAVRAFIPLVAIPVYAIWNAVVTAWVLRESRVRAFGPLAVRDLAQHVTGAREGLSPECRRLIVQAVSEAIVRTGNADPNYHLLLGQLVEALEVSPEEISVTWESARHAAASLTESERQMFLTILAVAVVIDGRVRRSEAVLLEEAHRLCNRPFERAKLDRRLKAFLQGQGIREE